MIAHQMASHGKGRDLLGEVLHESSCFHLFARFLAPLSQEV